MNESDVRSLLGSGVVEIVFEKADGSNRKMFATTSNALIPESQQHESEEEPSGDLVRVFDLQKNGWRSLKASKVTAIDRVPAAVWALMKGQNEGNS